jgi:hypothetical protein
MKLLSLEAYLTSVNESAGITVELEASFVKEMHAYVEQLVMKHNLTTNVMGVSMHLFHVYTKHVPYTEFDRTMLASVCLYLACKIDYIHIRMAEIMQFYHENRKGPKKRKPFEEVKDQLTGDFTELEIKVLKLIEFDFDFQLPFDSLRVYRDRRLLGEAEGSL